MMNLEEFLACPYNNSYLWENTFEIYARRGYHRVGDRVVLCFDIAKVENHGFKGRGEFWKLITKLKNLLETRPELRQGITCIYVESVLNLALGRSLVKHGFTVQPGTEPPSYYLKLENGTT